MAFNGELLEIFSWLPAKAIFKFAAVCRAANHLVTEDFFIKNQYVNSQSKDMSLFLLEPNTCDQRYRADNLELHSLRSSEAASAGIPVKYMKFLKNTSRILASSSGLLFCRNLRRNCVFICNPATQTRLPIPSPSGLDLEGHFNIVFECNNGSANDYTLIMLIPDFSDWSSSFQVKLYSQEGIWKEGGLVNFGHKNINLEMPVYHNGTVYFASGCGWSQAKGSPFYWPYIVSMSIKDRKVKFLSVPKSSRKGLTDMYCRIGIFIWGNASSSTKSICLVKLARKRCYVWALVDENLSSWTLILKKRVQAMGLIEDGAPSISGFTVLNGESLLLATEKRVYSYNLASQNEGMSELISSHKCGGNVLFHPYANTLRPCGSKRCSTSS